jgi:hypothetical protein
MQHGRHRLTPEKAKPIASAPAALPIAAWYDDPENDTLVRWWSGTGWTEHRYPRPGIVSQPAASAREPQAQYDRPASFVTIDSGAEPDLRSRIPAQSLMEQLTRLRAEGGFEKVANGRRILVPAAALPWYIGAVGERRVAAILSRLGPEWTVLHSVPVGIDGSDIDHVLIGPPGVYTLNTKHHPGRSAWVAGRNMQIAGHPEPYLYKAASEARRAEKLLTKASGITVEAAGVIVLVGVTSLSIKAKPEGGDVTLGVVRDRDLLAALRSRRIYSDEQVKRIADAAVRPDTWSPLPLPADDTVAMLASFDELENGVAAADIRERRPKAFRTFVNPPAPRPRSRARSGSGSNRRRKRKASALEGLLQAAGLFIAAWIAYNMFSHH